jgi:drug/metabolite transporter (DMT)-like permease
MDRDTRIGITYILVSTLGYACLPIFTKFIYQYSDLVPLDLAIWRFVFGIPLMWLAVTLWERRTAPEKLKQPVPRIRLLLTGVLLGGAALTAVYGLRVIDAAPFVVLFFTYPAMTGVISALLGKPLPLRGWIALVLTMIGVVFTAPEVLSFSLSGDQLTGVLIALLNALLVAFYVLWIGHIMRGYRATAYSSAWSITGTALLLIPMLLTMGVSVPSDLSVWLLFIGMSAFSTVLPIIGLNMGVQKLGASRAAILGTLEPGLAVLLAFVLLGERMVALQWVGTVLILASILILEVRVGRLGRKLPSSAAAENV